MAGSQSRRLAAILAADIAGYSALMGADEARTVRDLKEHQAIVLPMIGEFGGRIIDTAGDGILAEFGSVVNALECAVSIQRKIAERNGAIETERHMQLRIGINVGDIIVDEARIYGDGVNVAARLESVAEPGGICVSARVREDAIGRLAIDFEDMGERTLKNIARPMRLYRVMLDGKQSRTAPRTANTLSPFGDRPRFAVLPFNNLSGDPEQEYFADGITEDLIAAIANWCRFPVIARNSSFVYKGRSVDSKQVGQELGARYLIEGSVRKSGSRVRVSAQLLDSSTGHQLWADRYDRDIGDIFAIQDEITASIAAAVEPELLETEEHRAAQTIKADLAAYDLVQRGNWHHNQFAPTHLEEAQRLFAAAIEIEPSYSRAYSSMAYTKYWVAQMLWTKDREGTLQSALEYARKAVALDGKDPRAHMHLGQVSLWVNRHDDAIMESRRAIALNPSLAQAYSVLGYSLACIGQFEEAITTVEQSVRLRPNDRTVARCIPAMSLAHYQLGAFGEAEAIARRAVTMNPIFWIGHQMLAASLGQLGRKEEAAEEIAEIRRKEPGLSRAAYCAKLPFRDPIYAERIEDGVIKAGWSE